MKRLKILCAVCMLIAATLALTIQTAAASPYVIDNAGVLSEADINALNEAIAEFESSSDAKFRLVIKNGESLLHDTTVAAMFNMSVSEDLIAVVVSITADEYFYDPYLMGDTMDKIDGGERRRIFDADEVYDAIKFDCDIPAGIIAMLDLLPVALNGSLRPSALKVALISSIIGLIVAAIVAIVIYCKYKKKLKSEIYPLERYAALNLTASDDRFITKIVTKTARSSSGGRSGGRSGGGGGSSHCGRR